MRCRLIAAAVVVAAFAAGEIYGEWVSLRVINEVERARDEVRSVLGR